jgi:phosphoribosylpyrophosphate synthetase
LADLVRQSLEGLERSLKTVTRPDCWIALAATQRQLERCRCNPSHELARALSRLTAVPLRSEWLAQDHSEERIQIEGIKVVVSEKIFGRSVGLVLDQLDSLDLVVRAAQVLRVAGARQVVVVCAAKNHSLWQNHDHVSCNPG